MNLVDYAQTTLDDLSAKPFNAVDSLILSQLAYLRFAEIVPGLADPSTSVRIAELLKAELIPRMLEGVRDPEHNHQLLMAVGMSPRYRDIRLAGYCEQFDLIEQKQFAAVTCLVDDHKAYVAFRGTDSTIVGWKEDFNMAFIAPVPSQVEGAIYLNGIAAAYPHDLMVGGHSKGGNIAVYAAMASNSAIRDRITAIYSHDGPGFREEVLASEAYSAVMDRVRKTLPQFSLVGMLLQQQENYRVVESRQLGILQHDPFSWVIRDGDFHYLEELANGAEHLDTVISQWLQRLDDERRELFVNTLYSVFESTGIVTFNDFSEERHQKARIALDNIRGIDGETRRFVFDTIRSLLALYVKNFRLPLKFPLTIPQFGERSHGTPDQDS